MIIFIRIKGYIFLDWIWNNCYECTRPSGHWFFFTPTYFATSKKLKKHIATPFFATHQFFFKSYRHRHYFANTFFAPMNFFATTQFWKLSSYSKIQNLYATHLEPNFSTLPSELSKGCAPFVNSSPYQGCPCKNSIFQIYIYEKTHSLQNRI